jgi:hypothetical protein
MKRRKNPQLLFHLDTTSQFGKPIVKSLILKEEIDDKNFILKKHLTFLENKLHKINNKNQKNNLNDYSIIYKSDTRNGNTYFKDNLQFTER